MGFQLEHSLAIFCGLSIFVSVIIALLYRSLMNRIRWMPPAVHTFESTPRLTVIIPARNEAKDLAASLDSVLQQEGIDLEIILVNDHSTDGTREIADRYAQSDPRITVIHDPELREGWLGKVNAMQHAFARVTTDLVLFTDADVIHDQRCFISALSAMEDEQLDLVSFFPRIDCVSVMENADVPLYMGGFCQIVRETMRPDARRAIAAGAFILVRTAALKTSGGLAAIKTEMLDDIWLATIVKRSGHRVAIWAGQDLVKVRLFKDNWHALWGPTKNILAEMPDRVWMTPIVALLPLIIFGAPLLAVLVGALRGPAWLLALGAATYAIQYLGLLPFRDICSFRPFKLLFFPLVSIVVLCCTSLATYHYFAHGAVYWRGRSIRVRPA